MSTSSVGSSGSMIDVNGIVSKLMVIEQRPLEVIGKRVNTTQVSISAMSQLRASVDAASSAATAMQDVTMLLGKSASSSAPDVATTTLTDVGFAAAGKYDFELLKFASPQRVAFFGGWSDPSEGRGSEQIRIASDPSSSSPAMGAFDVTLDFSGNSLYEIRDAINADANLQGKVTASVVQSWRSDGRLDQVAGYKLVISGASTGVDAGFTVDWNVLGDTSQPPVMDDGTGLFQADRSPYTGGVFTGGGGAYGGTLASNAVAEVNGIKFGSATNVFTDAIPGVRVDALKASSGSFSAKVAVTVQNNRDEVAKRAQKFASALTDLSRLVDQLTKPGSDSSAPGPLAGNSAVLSIGAAVSSAYSQGFKLSGDSDTTYYWNKLGFDRSRDGAVTVNTSTLASMLGDSSSFASSFFAGFSSSIARVLSGFRGVGGSIQAGIQSMQVELKSLSTRQSETQTRLERTRQNLIAKYSKLDAQLVSANQKANNIRGSLASV